MAPKAYRRATKAGTKSRRKRAAKAQVVPGYTRVGGPYARAMHGSVEKKYIDKLDYQVNISGAGTVRGEYLLVNSGQGVSQRIGNKISCVNVNYRGVLTGWSDMNATGASQRLRYIFFWDTQANGDAPRAIDILQSGTIDSFRNMENASRFIVMKDKTITLNQQTRFTNGANEYAAEQERAIKFSWKGNMPIHYGTPTQPGDPTVLDHIRSNNLCLLIIASNDTTGAQLSGHMRVKYTDS